MSVNQVFSSCLMRAVAQPSFFGLLACGLLTLPAAADVIESFTMAPHRVVLVDGHDAPTDAWQLDSKISPAASQEGKLIEFELHNRSNKPLAIKEIVLFDWGHGLPSESAVYGEGYTMLSQTGGTLGEMVDLTRYSDHRHYRLPVPDGFHAVYGMMTITPPERQTQVLGFTSCKRFVGKFYVNADRIQVVVDTEGLELPPGSSWRLEELFVAEGDDRNKLLEQLSGHICRHHPRLDSTRYPTGWCSWYFFGPSVTAQNVIENLDVIRRRLPQLRFVQVDDGYQPWMGDWLETGEAFGGGVRDVLRNIRDAGLEPAIWVAPFVASPQSRLFREHPDWFVKDDDGIPLPSNKVTFGGWRLGPWYMLDGTHPGSQAYLEHVFRTMREQWGCTYFKLDANAWGAMPFGRRHDPNATAVEAYRQGMAAIRRGAQDAFLLGCNHPLWPSLGEIHGSRSSADIARKWDTFAYTGRENLMRNWQNRRLWWNDPDCLLLTGTLSPDEFAFHKSVLYATGGMILSGDDLTQLSEVQIESLQKLTTHQGVAATFDSQELGTGTISESDRTLYVLINWSDKPVRREVALDKPCRLVDFWSGEDLGPHRRTFVLETMPPHSARLLVASAAD
ncbi:MAG: glycoside hydrolase family 36 protein [Pirellulales bacterium]